MQKDKKILNLIKEINSLIKYIIIITVLIIVSIIIIIIEAYNH